jgi:hypothetical protein
VIVNDVLGPSNTWETNPANNCLIIGYGKVQDSGDALVLWTDANFSNKVITLAGAGWNSEVGDTGSAQIHDTNCSPRNQNWELVEKD